MPISDSRRRANNKWAEKHEPIQFRVQKGQKEIIQHHAADCNESLNAFIVRAINETMAWDKEKREQEK